MMNVRQAGVIDPILTSIAKGFQAQNKYVGPILFPEVPVETRTGTLIVFGDESFQVVDTERAPGESIRRVSMEYGSEAYKLRDYGLEGVVPNEVQDESQSALGLNLAASTLTKVVNRMALEKEVKTAAIARNAISYASSNKAVLSGSNMFSDPASDPFTIFETGKEAVRRKCGSRPNLAIIPSSVLSELRKHPKVLDRLSTSSDRLPATIAQLQTLFEFEQIEEAGAIKKVGSAYFDVWGNDVVLAFSMPKSMADMGSQSYGYDYTLGGGIKVEEAYADRNRRSIILPVIHVHEVYLTCPNAGYLIQNAVPAQV